MELEIYEAFTAANVPADKAKAAVESINREIDRRYSLHAQQLATRGDVKEVKQEMAEMEARLLKALNEMQRWTLTTIFAAVAALAVINKIF
jgi:multidrug resistance efflux pump